MEELLDVLTEIRDSLVTMNTKLDDLKYAIEEVKGDGVFNTVSDVYNKMETVESSIDEIKDSLPPVSSYNLDDVYNVLSELDSHIL